LVELYTSIQGEGPNTGHLIQFIRFGGCNMRCADWPCDTEFAIDTVKYGDQWKVVDPDELIRLVNPFPKHVCLTGGEPLAQRSRELEQFVKALPRDWKIDVFTNGSQAIPTWAFDHRVYVVMDWKLPGSGENTEAYEQKVKANCRVLWPHQAIKFVCKDEEDLEHAADVTDWLYHYGVRAQIWAGAAFGHLTPEQVMNFALARQLPWKINVQVHKYIWSPEARGV
jgi:7-carboxy-7-deazaguanine synthase